MALGIYWFCVLVINTTVFVDSVKIFNYCEVEGVNDMYTSNSSLITFTDISSKLQCACECSVNADCLSFFFSKTLIFCILHSTMLTSGILTIENGWKYFTREIDCPSASGFVFYKVLNMCYKIVNVMLSWEDSKSACRMEQGTLVKIDSTAKQFYFEDLLRSSGESRDYHIGLYRTGPAEGNVYLEEWQWQDGTPVDKTQVFWDGAEYSRTNEYCTELNYNFHYTWNVMPCFEKGGYICEIHV